jgi:hypothetical protein
MQEVNTAKNRKRNDTVESQLFKALYAEMSNRGEIISGTGKHCCPLGLMGLYIWLMS